MNDRRQPPQPPISELDQLASDLQGRRYASNRQTGRHNKQYSNSSRKKCPKCRELISKKAKICPYCKSKQPPSAGATMIGVITFFALIALGIYSAANMPETPRTEEEIRLSQLKKHFSTWDGSHKGLTKLIKSAMNDPDSYKHVSTNFWDNGDHLIVNTTFRGRNAFGGVVKHFVKAKVDLQGNVLEIIEQDP